jgi:serine/threonine protein kinase
MSPLLLSSPLCIWRSRPLITPIQGASGSVYSAIDTRTGKKVAVKQMIMSKYVIDTTCIAHDDALTAFLLRVSYM